MSSKYPSDKHRLIDERLHKSKPTTTGERKTSKAKSLFDKAVKAIGSPYSGGFVSWRDITYFNHIKPKEGCIFHERKEQGLDGEYQILVIMRKV